MDLFSQFENFEEKEEYWGMDNRLWDWTRLFNDKQAIIDYVDTTFITEGIGIRKFKVARCVEFYQLATQFSKIFEPESQILDISQELKDVAKELKAVYEVAVQQYYGQDKVNIPTEEGNGAVRALNLPFGPWIFMSKIEWQDYLRRKRTARLSALVAASTASAQARSSQGGMAHGATEAAANASAGMGNVSASANAQAQGSTRDRGKGEADGTEENQAFAEQVRMNLEQEEISMRQQDDSKQEESDATGRGPRRPRHRVSFNEDQDNNHNRNRRSRSRDRDSSVTRRRQQAQSSSAPPSRATASFDQQGFDDIVVNDRSSAVKLFCVCKGSKAAFICTR